MSEHLAADAGAVVVFGVLSILLMGGGYLFFDWICRKVDLQGNVGKDNKSCAVLSSAFVLGVALVVATVVNGVLR